MTHSSSADQARPSDLPARLRERITTISHVVHDPPLKDPAEPSTVELMRAAADSLTERDEQTAALRKAWLRWRQVAMQDSTSGAVFAYMHDESFDEACRAALSPSQEPAPVATGGAE